MANQDELDELIETWTTNYTPHEVMRKLQSSGVIAGAIQNPKDKVEDDPQLKHRGYLQEVEHAELGSKPLEGEPIHLSRSPWELKRAAPLLGEHDYFVFNEILGVEDEEMAQLMTEGAI